MSSSIGSKLWQKLTRKSSDSVHVVVKRILQVFQDHGVEISQIPRLLSKITLADLQSSEKLLESLTPEILDQTAKLFGIRSQWLEGADERIYEPLTCYKQPEVFLQCFASLPPGQRVSSAFPVKVLVTTKDLNKSDSREQLIALVLAEKIAEFGDAYIYRYHVFQDAFRWSYEPARIELKALARILFKRLRILSPLFQIREQDMRGILEGSVIPAKFVEGCQLTSPSLEDFAMSNEESAVAKEVEELPAVLQYIEEHGMQEFSFDMVEATQPSNVQAQPKAKPLKSSQIDKKFCQDKALELWKTSSLNITAMSKHPEIRKAGGINYAEKTAQKWLREVAPPHIKGKRGRPKKSNP